jgi:hypothetical protein
MLKPPVAALFGQTRDDPGLADVSLELSIIRA